jgi:hypothetical protein
VARASLVTGTADGVIAWAVAWHIERKVQHMRAAGAGRAIARVMAVYFLQLGRRRVMVHAVMRGFLCRVSGELEWRRAERARRYEWMAITGAAIQVQAQVRRRGVMWGVPTTCTTSRTACTTSTCSSTATTTTTSSSCKGSSSKGSSSYCCACSLRSGLVPSESEWLLLPLLDRIRLQRERDEHWRRAAVW